MKKWFLTLLLFILVFPIISHALVKPSNKLYVTDEAKVLSKDTEEYIIKYSDYLSKVKKVRYYVVTVPYLENYDIETYANFVFDSFNMGSKGVLVLFSKEDNAVQVVLGKELMDIMSDIELENYINQYFISYFKNLEWDKGIKNGYVSLYKKICDYYHMDSSTMEVVDGNSILVKYRLPILTGIIFISMILGYTLCSFFKKIYLRTLNSFLEYASFGIVFVLNIVLLIFSYYLEPWYLLLILIVEFLMFVTIYDTSKNMSLEEAFARIKKEEARAKTMKRPKKNMKKRKS